MITHAALLAAASGALSLAGFGEKSLQDRGILKLGPNDVHISYLPSAHIMERLVFSVIMIVGGSIGYYQGDNLKIVDDIAALRPTLFCSVPRLLNRIYDKVMGGVKEKGFFARALFDLAYKAKLENLSNYGDLEHWLWDALVFSKIRERFGGRIRGILSGAAPISPSVMNFLRVCLSCEVYEGYGATETCGGTALTVSGDWSIGNVGVPIPSNEIKLVDIPEMDYTSKDQPHPRGEICIRGPNCFNGYYKDEEKTREAIDNNGWVHTGDVGEWDERGRLKIIDRKKNLFKLAQGEYVAPEKIESHLAKNPYIHQSFVHGDSLKSFLVALIVPEHGELLKWKASQESISQELSYSELLVHPAVVAFYKTQLASFGREGSNELKGFEIPREIALLPDPFTIENDLLTPSFKLKRFEVRRRYQDAINELLARIKE